jgi:hypothetical protein
MRSTSRRPRAAAKSRDDQNDEDRTDEDQDEPEEANENEGVESRFGKWVSVGLSPKQSKKLNGLADKTRIKIIGYVCMSSDDSLTIDVRRLVKLKNRTTSDSKLDRGDWEE